MLKTEKITYYKNKFDEHKSDVKSTWKMAYEFLGKTFDLSPKQITLDGERITSPEKLAETFNKAFLDKVEKLKRTISAEKITDPEVRLANWLNKRAETFPEFEIRTIRGAVKKKIR